MLVDSGGCRHLRLRSDFPHPETTPDMEDDRQSEPFVAETEAADQTVRNRGRHSTRYTMTRPLDSRHASGQSRPRQPEDPVLPSIPASKKAPASALMHGSVKQTSARTSCSNRPYYVHTKAILFDNAASIAGSQPRPFSEMRVCPSCTRWIAVDGDDPSQPDRHGVHPSIKGGG